MYPHQAFGHGLKLVHFHNQLNYLQIQLHGMLQMSRRGHNLELLLVRKVVTKMKIENCPKYEKCSAPICPLDPNWERAIHLNHERVCFYLCEAQKENSEAIFGGRGLSKLHQIMVEVAPAISCRWTTIKKALTRAAKSGSRMLRKPPIKSFSA